jgi:nicotinamidase-related amidase
MTVVPNRAHLCVDMQRMFLEDTAWHLPYMAKVLPAIEALVDAHPTQTIFTRFIPPVREQAHRAWGAYYDAWPTMRRERLSPELLELVPNLQRYRLQGHQFDKSVFSPWWSGELHQLLQRNGVDTLVVTGGETEVCVAATILGAFDLGYHVVLPLDALCSSADEGHDAMVSIYRSRFGVHLQTCSTQDVLDSWR